MRRTLLVAACVVAMCLPLVMWHRESPTWSGDPVAAPTERLVLTSFRVWGLPVGSGKDCSYNKINLSVLVETDAIRVGLTTGDIRRVPRTRDPSADWQHVVAVLDERKEDIFVDRKDIEIALSGEVSASELWDAVESARSAGFPDARVMTPDELSVRF